MAVFRHFSFRFNHFLTTHLFLIAFIWNHLPFQDSSLNKCHREAACQDTDDGYLCHCKEGFYDNSPNPREPGRICISRFLKLCRSVVHKMINFIQFEKFEFGNQMVQSNSWKHNLLTSYRFQHPRNDSDSRNYDPSGRDPLWQHGAVSSVEKRGLHRGLQVRMQTWAKSKRWHAAVCWCRDCYFRIPVSFSNFHP